MGLFDRNVGALLARSVGMRPARRAAGSIDAATPIAEAPYVAFDTELTGLRPRTDSIVSIGALRMEGGRILVGSRFHRLVQPRTELTRSSVIIHGITPGDTRESPDIGSVLPEFEDFCGERILVGHAVSIDLDFLGEEAGRHGIPPIANPAVDTMALHRFVCRRTEERCAFHDKEPGPMDLYTLAAERGIPVGRPHDALSDAYLTAQLFQQFLAVLPAHGVRTVGDLLEIGQP